MTVLHPTARTPVLNNTRQNATSSVSAHRVGVVVSKRPPGGPGEAVPQGGDEQRAESVRDGRFRLRVGPAASGGGRGGPGGGGGAPLGARARAQRHRGAPLL
eukprot:97553-Prorocentrum_minimum.AAC.1